MSKITTFFVALLSISICGCARNPYYSDTAAQHMMITCDPDNCGKPVR
jgi:hypothetical protein